MSNTKWDFTNLNANEPYDKFLEIFLIAYNECFPVKQTKLKKRTKSPPWFNDEIRQLVKKKNRLYKLYLKNRTDYRKNVYKAIRNKIVNKIKHAKNVYFRKQLNKAKGNMNKTWNVINKATGKKIRKPILINLLLMIKLY